MSVHRPHPISGPWPYLVDTSRDPGGVDVPNIARVPADDALIYDDPEDALLFDGCDRCAEHAAEPFLGIDNDRIAALWREMVAVERDSSYRDYYRTKAEARACGRLYRLAVFIERTQPALDPWRWPWAPRAGAASVNVVNVSAPDVDAERAAGYLRGVADERSRRG